MGSIMVQTFVASVSAAGEILGLAIIAAWFFQMGVLDKSIQVIVCTWVDPPHATFWLCGSGVEIVLNGLHCVGQSQ